MTLGKCRSKGYDAAVMNGRLLLCLLAFACLSVRGRGADETQAPLLAATDDAGLKAAVGQTVIVRGTVTRTGKSKATGVNFLNFASGDFTIVTFGRNLKDFAEGEPADVYKDKHIEIRGEVILYKEKAQIELTSPGQIRIVDEAAVAEASRPHAPPGDREAPSKEKVGDPAAADEGKPTKIDPKKYFTD